MSLTIKRNPSDGISGTHFGSDTSFSEMLLCLDYVYNWKLISVMLFGIIYTY